MMRQALWVATVFAVFMEATAACMGQHCGEERWDVKTLRDSAARNVNFVDTIHSSVRKQTQLQPFRPSTHNPRMKRVEMKFYSIKAWLVGMVREDDRDYHLVLKDLTTDDSMVVEIPDPDCPEVAETQWANQYRTARTWIDTNIHVPTACYHAVIPGKVVITGVGYYDRLHGQRGMAANGREIHPVLSIEAR
jgi:hypothetical protein